MNLCQGPPSDQERAVASFFESVHQTGRCVVMTDLDDTLTAVFGGDLEERTVAALVDYLDAGGLLVFNTGAPFDWFYARLLQPLIAELVAWHGSASSLARVLLILSGGNEISVFHLGGYRSVSHGAGRDKGGGLDQLVQLSGATDLVPALRPKQMMYIGDSFGPGGIDRAIAGKVGVVVNVGRPVLDLPGQLANVGGGYLTTVDLFATAAAALRASGRAPSTPPKDEISDTTLWTFEHPHFPAHRQLCIRVGAPGFVHAGVTQADGRWDPLYEMPLIATGDGNFEAILPAHVDTFTFFWTEGPRSADHPGHWEREERGGQIFRLASPSASRASTNEPRRGLIDDTGSNTNPDHAR